MRKLWIAGAAVAGAALLLGAAKVSGFPASSTGSPKVAVVVASSDAAGPSVAASPSPAAASHSPAAAHHTARPRVTRSKVVPSEAARSKAAKPTTTRHVPKTDGLQPTATPYDPRLHEEPIDTDDQADADDGEAREHRPFSTDGRPIAGVDEDYR